MDARQLQQLLQGSGLTLDQLRSRLRSAGYSENLLDPYFSGRTSVMPDSGVFAAIQALRLVTGRDTASNSRRQPGDRPRIDDRRDTTYDALLDSVATAVGDSVTRAAIIELLRSRELQRSQLDSGFTLFGVDVFNRANTLFDANDAGPVPPDYRLGPGDELVLILTGDTERSFMLPVTREGMVYIPNVGGVSVANMSIRQLEEVLYSRLANAYSGIRRGGGGTTNFQLTVSNLGSIQVSVVGDVVTPGAYRISKLGTVLTALHAAGGPTQNGSLRRVEVRRGGRLVGTVDAYDYLIGGSTGSDLKLESGDVVLVPPLVARVRVAGAVTRPATYELRERQTLGELVRIAGGFRPEADRRRVQIERIVPPSMRVASGSDRVLFDVAGTALESSTEPLLPGDVVRVHRIAQRIGNKVRIVGNVWSPGPLALTPGMRVSEAIARAGGLKPDSYREAVQITRLQPDSTHRMLRVTFAPPGSATLVEPAADVALQPDDEIRVFSVTEYRPSRHVTIGGAVGKSGEYPYREGMTVRDLLLMAGGLQEGALLTEAEVARMPSDRRNGTTAVTMRVPLDSSYLFDRPPGQAYQGPPGVPAPARQAPEVELKPYDNVTVLQQPDWLLPRIVSIKGEVRYPGDYALKSKAERLVDLIERAGGLTADAYAGGIIFTRSQDSVGRIGIDLPAALRRRSHPDNILLAHADSIEIPFRSAVVMVTGAVNSPVAVPYVPGQIVDYYVYSAGGPTARGDIRRAYVIQANGKVESKRRIWLQTTYPVPQPGSTVAVPELVPRQSSFTTTIVTATTLISTMIALIAVVK